MKIVPDAAIHLLHEASHAVLATHSTRLPGYPYASAVALAVDARHRPVLLISALAEHTKNLLADPRASLSLVEDGQPDVQIAARMTLLGSFERIDARSEAAARYRRYRPEAEQHQGLDFMYFRLQIECVRFIAGIGKMGWLDATDWSEVKEIEGGDEIALLEFSHAQVVTDVSLLGIDAYGADCLVDGIRVRRRFEKARSADELTEGILRLVRPST